MEAGGPRHGNGDLRAMKQVELAGKGASGTQSPAGGSSQGTETVGKPGDNEARLRPPGFPHQDGATMFH